MLLHSISRCFHLLALARCTQAQLFSVKSHTVEAAAAVAYEALPPEYSALQRMHEATLRKLHAAEADGEALHQLVTDPGAIHQSSDGSESSALGNEDFAVRRSGIKGAGRGAFARRSFVAGQRIGRYICLVVLSSAVRDDFRSWKVNATHKCDGSVFPLHNPMLYINSVAALETCDKQNVEMVLDELARDSAYADLPNGSGD